MINRPNVLHRWITLLVLALCGTAAAANPEGNPLTRLYSFAEIGCSADGALIGHDPYGRIAVVQGGEISVLNDTIWRKVRGRSAAIANLGNISLNSDGTAYFGAVGAWGTFRKAEGGTVQAEILTPADTPDWVRATKFDQILTTPTGVFFSGIHGVVYRDTASGAHSYFNLPGTACVFPYMGQILVSSYDRGLFTIDPGSGTSAPTRLEPLHMDNVVASVGDGQEELLVATALHRLYRLKDGTLEPLQFGSSINLPGRVTGLIQTPDGVIAAAIAGWGILLLERDGRIRNTCNGYEYTSISSLKCNEPGVLWAATEGGLLKILYGQPVTTFNRSLGLPVEWPQMVSWKGAAIVSSGGHLYETTAGIELEPHRFRFIKDEPPTGGWGIATIGSSLLIGNGNGVYCASEGHDFVQVIANLRVARLVAINANTCLSIGADEIAAFRLQDGVWAEVAPRIPGVGFPYMAHAGPDSAWIELGLNRVARIALIDGRLTLRLIEDFPWAKPSWVNVSIVGTTVALCGEDGPPIFLDARTLESADAPVLRQLFANAPYKIMRLHRDHGGDFWISHPQGLYLARISDSEYETDLASFIGVSGPTPRVFSLPEGSVWAATGNTLYRLHKTEKRDWPLSGRPLLVSMRDSRTGAQLPLKTPVSGSWGTFRYSQNSIQLDLFAGSYAFVRPFAYEFRLNEGRWMQSAADSSLFLPDLHEGDYRLHVRIVDSHGVAGRSEEFHFAVLPPWYRCWYAWVAYPVLICGLVWAIFQLSARRARRRQASLEKQIVERTDELRSAMDRLQQEALTSAILTERNRLAAEIHDSIEQGFAGVALQIESTAELNGCPPRVRTGLGAALNMIAFCRTEIRHAIRGLHSPALGSADLGTVLKQIVAQLAPMPDYATIRIEGTPQRIDSAAEHHLLRIAQEAVANALKHASAKHLEIALHFGPTEIRLSISDDGRGFVPEDAINGNSEHLGLRSLRNRASKIGGAIQIQSRPGAGTSILVTLPSPISPAPTL